MRYTHLIRIYRRRFQLSLTLILSLLVFVLLILFARSAQIDLKTLILGLASSTYRVVIAYLISLIVGVLVALVVTKNQFLEDLLLPILDVAQSFPSFAILPIAILWFGATDFTAIFFLVITILWPVLFNVVAGVKNIRGDMAEAAEIFGAKGWKKLVHFLFPALLPAIVTGSIVGWGEAWEAIVGAEIIGITVGIGAFLAQASKAGEASVLTVGIGILLFFIFFLNKLIWLPLLKRATSYQTE